MIHLLKELHLYPKIGFNDMQFGYTESRIRDVLGDPYLKGFNSRENLYYGSYNDGNLLLWFSCRSKKLHKIQYNILPSSRTHLYLQEDAVSPHSECIIDWMYSEDPFLFHHEEYELYHSKMLSMRLFPIKDYRGNVAMRLIELTP